ncbi:MAG: carboxylate-amine ligase [Rhizobiales bacterium]|nr:carboxylate-amine ligase [Hyphomicrobiales bacterium]
MAENYSFGIEEEYFIVDADTKAVQRRMPSAFLAALKTGLGSAVTREMLQSQLEVATKPSTDFLESARELRALRRNVGAISSEFGFAFIAAGTHPTAAWTSARQTEAMRYDAMTQDLQMLAERNMLCGLHVHVELPDADRRVEIMRRAPPFIPHFIALATSSPFWNSRRTGLMGYRLAAYDELPRTGLPPLFFSNEDFKQYKQALIDARVLPDGSYLWWSIRLSEAHPTLELRAPDCCTRIEDSIALAALYRCLLRHLFLNKELNAVLTPVDYAIASENKWRAQRYGIHGSFVDREQGRAVPVREAVGSLVARIAGDAKALGCESELALVNEIFETGTSADAQITVFNEAERRTKSRGEALKAVKNWLAATTIQ